MQFPVFIDNDVIAHAHMYSSLEHFQVDMSQNPFRKNKTEKKKERKGEHRTMK